MSLGGSWLRQLARYGMVGLLCAGINLVVLYIGTSLLGWSYLWSLALSFAILAPLSYVLNKVIAFQDASRVSALQFGRYVVSLVLGLLVSFPSMYGLVDGWGWHYLLAAVLVTALQFLLNFGLQALWVFRDRERHGRPAHVGGLRIVMVSQYFPAHRGGVEGVAGQLAAGLAGRQWSRISWFASDSDPAPVVDGVQCQAVPAWNPLEARWQLPYPLWTPRILPVIWREIGRADVVHVHDYIYVGSLLVYVLAKCRRKPVVITQHVGAVPFRQPVLRHGLLWVNRTLGRLLLAHADGVAFVSAVVREEFMGRRAAASIKLIPNGVDLQVFSVPTVEQRVALRQRLGLAPDRPVLLFVGRFVEKKGLLLLERLTAELPEMSWLFAGWGPLDPAAWARPNVQVFRDRCAGALAELYQAADLLVLPSVGEGFPLVVQEAMACGTPALVGQETARALPGLEDLLLAESVTDAAALARWRARIRGVMAQPEALQVRRLAAADWARRHWSWERCCADYRSLMLHAIAWRRARS